MRVAVAMLRPYYAHGIDTVGLESVFKPCDEPSPVTARIDYFPIGGGRMVVRTMPYTLDSS